MRERLVPGRTESIDELSHAARWKLRRGHAVEVEDLGSTNGTLLNGVPLKPYRPASLNDGDQLQLGQLVVKIEFDIHPLRRAGSRNGVPGSHGLTQDL